MNKTSFIMKEIRFVMKTCGSSFLMSGTIYIAFLLLTVLAFQKSIPDTSLPPEVRSTVIAMMVEAILSFSIINIVLFQLFPIGTIVSNEKNDKVFEQMFTIPVSASKLVLYRFMALFSTMTLSIAIQYLITSFTIAAITGNLYLIYVLRAFALSLMLTLSLGYMDFLNSMLIPAKYSGLIHALVFIIIPITQSTFSIFSGSLYTSTESFLPSIIIASIIMAIAGLVETIIVKDKIVERVITTS